MVWQVTVPSFAIVAILGEKKVRLSEITAEGELQQTLTVDLRNESYGIYNNAGKRFLQQEIASDALDERLIKQAKRFHEALATGIMSEPEFVWHSYEGELPLRWASGGFLPIVCYKEKYWAALFFRDIYPVGLNLACRYPALFGRTDQRLKHVQYLLSVQVPVCQSSRTERDQNHQHNTFLNHFLSPKK